MFVSFHQLCFSLLLIAFCVFPPLIKTLFLHSDVTSFSFFSFPDFLASFEPLISPFGVFLFHFPAFLPITAVNTQIQVIPSINRSILEHSMYDLICHYSIFDTLIIILMMCAHVKSLLFAFRWFYAFNFLDVTLILKDHNFSGLLACRIMITSGDSVHLIIICMRGSAALALVE